MKRTSTIRVQSDRVQSGAADQYRDGKGAASGSRLPYLSMLGRDACMLGRDSHLVPTFSRNPILRSMVSSSPWEGIPTNGGARRDSRTSGPLRIGRGADRPAPLGRGCLAMILSVSGLVLLSTVSCDRAPVTHPKVIVVGFDGMDPRLSERMMDDGLLPNLAKMRRAGGYKRLGTSIPPQSPVAWSNFITGANPGVHGIFDFIHRDPKHQYLPYYSAAKTIVSEDGWNVGDFKIPLTFWPFNHNPTQTLLKRHGVPFWDYLDNAGVPVYLYDIPANYPPSPSQHGHVCCLSGMGVPDLLGGYGTYQHFSERTARFRREKNEPGGKRFPLVFEQDRATATLVGPVNSYLKKPVDTNVAFQIYRHPTEPWARIDVQGQTIVLKEKEWSDWQKVEFELDMPPFLPNAHANGICRFYLQEVHPRFRLYVTPINIDPSDPAGQIISEPADFVEEISDELGLFYTAGFQEDHKALSNQIFSDAEYLEQANDVLEERMNLLQYAIDHYEDGLLFFYYSSTDVQGHMFWWDSDKPHPIRSASEARKYQKVIEHLYARADEIVGRIVERYGDEATILVMSDHGFCNFRREFNVNTWLRDNGYIRPANCKSLLDPRRRPPVNWRRTKAYGLGLNGIYVNLQGRERDGIVDPSKKDALLDEIKAGLLAVRDPIDGAPVIATVYRSDEVYSGPFADTGPDLIVGYHRGYRASWATTLGEITNEVLSDNSSAWSADHCIAAEEVPGVIFSNKPLQRENPSLIDLAPTILEEFGVEPSDVMSGGSLFRRRSSGSVTVAGARIPGARIPSRTFVRGNPFPRSAGVHGPQDGNPAASRDEIGISSKRVAVSQAGNALEKSVKE